MTPDELTEMLPWSNRPVFRHADVGQGWVDLVMGLHRDLLVLNPGYTLAQVKEKFGGLRYYVDSNSDDPLVRQAMNAMIATAEQRSLRTCEECGSTGDEVETKSLTSSGGWISTRCPPCRAAAYARHQERLGENT